MPEREAPLVIAHRGASGLAPENTPAAFRLAMALGADGVEMDVQLSADDQVVVIHDARVDRTTRRRGPVAGFTAAELGRMNASEWFERRLMMRPRLRAMIERTSAPFGLDGWLGAGGSVPALASVLELLAPARLRRVYIELKGPKVGTSLLLNKAIALVRQFSMERSVTLLSFDHAVVALARKLAPDIRTAATFPVPGVRLTTPRAILAAAGEAGADEAALHFGLATRRTVAALHERGLAVSAWTANSKIIMRRLISSGVDSIMTNYPNRLVEVLEASGGGRQSSRRR
ncbi:MAG TPA: glycerophosphodiester phosphodiesterase family protein [Blastocatellia bacterium]|nr:glycerophosphodiester phosphodiesterase family protein [Blastocatellia bacterium]